MSELYASLLMLGVTLSFGSVVASMAAGQFAQGTSSASLGSALQAESSGRQLAFIYSVSTAQGSCPNYEGAPEGSTLILTFLDYGSQPFTPDQILVNGTSYYSTSYQTIAPGTAASYAVALAPAGTCVHSAGLSIMLTDTYGDEAQFET